MDLTGYHYREVSSPSYPLLPTDVARKAHDSLVDLFRARDQLQEITARHESRIRKRWGKKKKAQRKRILLQAWPDMPEQHRPDMKAWVQKSIDLDAKANDKAKEKEGKNIEEDTESNHNAYMWPDFNLEDLVHPELVLILLEERSRHEPYKFIDSDVARVLFCEAYTMRPELDDYAMLFHGRDTPESYGELVAVNRDTITLQEYELSIHPARGLKAIEIQCQIWKFLVDFCKYMLHDVRSLDSGEIQPRCEPMVCIRSEETTNETPYRVRGPLDYTGMRAIVEAERNTREDYVWALREDPGVFAETLEEQAQHMPERVLDAQGQRFPSIGHRHFWNRVLEQIFIHGYYNFALFGEIAGMIDQLQQVGEQYDDEVDLANDMPTDFKKSFLELLYTLVIAAGSVIGQLKICLNSSPPVRQFAERQGSDADESKIKTFLKQQYPGSHPVNRLNKSFEILSSVEESKYLYVPFGTICAIVDGFEHLIETDSGVRALISPMVARRFSSLSAISQCIGKLHEFQPRACVMAGEAKIIKTQLINKHEKIFDGWNSFENNVLIQESSLYRFANPRDNKFAYPVHCQRNKENVRVWRLAERNLDAFWRQVDTFKVDPIRGRSLHDLVAHLLTSGRFVRRTAPWVELTENQQSPILGLKPELQNEYEYRSFPNVEHSAVTQATDTFNTTSTPVKTGKTEKKKTRGIPRLLEPKPLPEAVDPVQEAPKSAIKTIKVNKHALSVFETVFHTPSCHHGPGEIPWKEFVNAMIAAGFSAQKLHGSVWSFTPLESSDSTESQRAIQFHQPHPSPKIPFHIARRHGRRLTRAYGWSAETFVQG